MPRAPGRLHWRAWERLRREVLDAHNWRCGCGCGRLAEEVHHVNGDRTDNREANLLPLAKVCHIAIHDRLRDRPQARAWRRMVRLT